MFLHVYGLEQNVTSRMLCQKYKQSSATTKQKLMHAGYAIAILVNSSGIFKRDTNKRREAKQTLNRCLPRNQDSYKRKYMRGQIHSEYY